MGACSEDAGDRAGPQTTGEVSTTTATSTTTQRSECSAAYFAALQRADTTGDLESISEGRRCELGLIVCEEFEQGASTIDVLDRLTAEPEFDIAEGNSTLGAVWIGSTASVQLCEAADVPPLGAAD